MSPRTRAIALVALASAAVAAIAVGGAVVQGRAYENDEAGEAHASSEPPPLELAVYASGPLARDLRAGERAYESGDAREAAARFAAAARRDPRSVEAAVGAAIAAWPEGTTDQLRRLVAENPESGVARLHLGLALFAEGDPEGARAAWEETERVDPDSPSALEAETLLHPDMPRGRPFFVPSRVSDVAADARGVNERLANLRARAEAGGAAAWIAYGVALQRAGRPVSARLAFDRARAEAPGSVEARTAAAVGRFDKDDPSLAFARLGPLVRDFPRSPVVRFHLGYLLLWLGQVEEATRQLELAVEAGPGTTQGRDARRLLAQLEK